jgi:3-phenylpropionate/trans-cinnamate dioxygenase ferredoxin reductase subunit
VGGSVAGGRAAETLRQQGFDGRIVLVGAEPERPYERPPLSKEYLVGKVAEDRLYLRPLEYYDEQGIELWLGARATRLAPQEGPRSRCIELADGRRLSYDKLLIATGAAPRQLPVPGAELPGILYLRTLRDARELRRGMAAASRVCVVGAGFIGAEVAASCRAAGLEVVLLEMEAWPLERALGREVGRLCAAIHRAHGVDLRTGQRVVGFRGHGRVEQVVTASGDAVDCDLVVVGVGVVPECGWLAGSGVALCNGVVVDEMCATNVPGVYAAGDVANWWHPTLRTRLRVEHFDNAQNQGVAAAKSLLGVGQPYAPVPFFWSDQYDLKLQYVGHTTGQDDVVLRGSVEAASWSAFYVRDGYLVAAVAANRFKDVAAARQLITRRVPVEARRLADESTDLRALAKM